MAKLGTGIMQKRRSLAKDKQIKEKRRILKLNKAKKEDWERYRIKLDEKLTKELELVSNIELIEEICKNKNINEIWNIISSNIIESAYSTLPSQKLFASKLLLKKLRSSDKIQKDLKLLGKICHICIKKED